MKARIAVLGGDGIGPEVTAEAVRVLQAVGAKFGHEFEFAEALIGGAAIDASGSALPPRTIDACRESAATLLGAVGGPKWSDPGAPRAPRTGPAGTAPHPRRVREPAPGAHACRRCSTPRRSSPRCITGTDIMVVRELTGGIYFGRKSRTAHEAEDVCTYTTDEVERVTRVAGRLAMGASPAHRLGRQGQRARDLAAVARSRRARAARRVPGGASSSTCWSTPPPCT